MKMNDVPAKDIDSVISALQSLGFSKQDIRDRYDPTKKTYTIEAKLPILVTIEAGDPKRGAKTDAFSIFGYNQSGTRTDPDKGGTEIYFSKGASTASADANSGGDQLYRFLRGKDFEV